MELQDAKQHRRDCRRCGALNRRAMIKELPESAKHYAVAMCPDCEGHWDWIAKPDSERKRRPAAHRKLVKKKQPEIRFCEICLRLETEMPDARKMEGHHILEYKNDGPSLTANVLVVCPQCHSLINNLRTYLIGVKVCDDLTVHTAAVRQQSEVYSNG